MSGRNSTEIQTISRNMKYEAKCENNKEENVLMVMQDMIGWRRGDRTVSLPLLIPSSLPRFSLTCSALMPHKDEAEANLLPAAALGNKRIYGCTQMNSSLSSYSTPTTANTCKS